MKTVWQLQDAKSHFSKVVEQASSGKAQIVTKHGKRTAVIISYEDYIELNNAKKSLYDHLHVEPFLDFELERDKDVGRLLDLE